MSKKFFRLISLYLTIILCVAIAMVITLLNHHFNRVEEDRLAAEAELAKVGIELSGSEYLEKLKTKGYRVTWIDDAGNVLFESDVGKETMDNHADRPETKDAIRNGYGHAIRYSKTLARKTIYYALYIPSDSTVIRIAETYDTVGVITLQLVLPILGILVFSIVCVGLLAKKLSYDIAKPINAINLDHPLRHPVYKELEPLLTRIDIQNTQIDNQVEELHIRKKEFEAVTKNINEGIILTNMRGDIITMNDAAKNLFNLDQLPTNVKDCLTSEHYQNLIEEVLRGEAKEIYIPLEDTTYKINANPILSHGIQTGASIFVTDVTEEYASEQMRQQFTANVSHELKTPLQSIMGYSELMANHLVDPKDNDAFALKIHEESKRMLRLIEDIIRLSQLDEGKIVDVVKLDLKDIAAEAKQALLLAANQHEITVFLHTQSVPVKGNARLIYEIFYNLLDNAIRYTKKNGYVKISTYIEKNEAVIEIKDNGIGIPRDAISHIFERFYRVDKSHSRNTGGTGLGLSIVKHAVQLSHGTISIASKLNQGSVFTVRLPLYSEEE